MYHQSHSVSNIAHEPAMDTHHPAHLQGINGDTLSAGSQINQLIIHAMPLLMLITQLRHTVEHPNVASLRAQVLTEIKTFEKKLTDIHYPMRILIAARYCLCTALDETVLSRPWGTSSVWVQESLLSLLHNETWGGERFYIILEDMLKDTRKHIDFIELVYYLLSLGFEGKFYGEQHQTVREEIRNRLFYRIRSARQKPDRLLSSHWKVDALPQNHQVRKRFLKRIGIFTLSVLIIIGAAFNFSLENVARPTVNKLNSLATDSPVSLFSQVINRPVIMR